MHNQPEPLGLWAKTAPPAPPTERLSGTRDVDVAVVGAGYTGLSAALHLAAGGARVAVLEGREIGFGGSGRNVGLVNAGLWIMPDALGEALGEPWGTRLLTALGDGPRLVFDLIAAHGIACEAVRSGTLHCGVGEAGVRELAERARQWQARGAPVELLDAEGTHRLTGTTAYAAALLDRRAGTINPLGYARGLARAAIDCGAEIFTASPVAGVRREGTRWSLTTGAGTVRADWIVVATNAYTRAPWPEVRSEIVHLPYFNIATAPLSANVARSILPERQGCWDTKEILSSFRFDAAGRLVFGSVGALRGTGAAIHRRWVRQSLRRLFPQLGEVTFEAQWYGMIGMTADALPRFHRLEERVVSFSGYNGRGIAPGTVFGSALADLILGRVRDDELPLPATHPTAQRFRTAREAFYEFGSQVAHLSSRL